jgi:voltage-gated potassium channel
MNKVLHVLFFVSILILLNVIGAIILIELESQMTYVDAFYLTMSASTTVGFGNVAAVTDSGKIFISFYQLIPITVFFSAISYIF